MSYYFEDPNQNMFYQPLNAYQPVPIPYVNVELIRRIQAENDSLRYRLAEKTMREDALKRAYTIQGECYWSVTASGRLVQITDFAFSSVRQLHFDSYFSQEPLIEISIKGNSSALLTEGDFLNDSRFFNLLQMRFGCKITPIESVSKVAVLLRSIACEKMEHVAVPFFSGWNLSDAKWTFRVFPAFRTCAKTALPVLPYEALPEVLPAAARISGEQLQEDFAAVCNPALRMTLLLWMHTAFLHTPLEAFGFRVSHALHITVPSLTAQDYLGKVLSFGTDSILSLDAESTDFATELVSRKDRTLIVRESQSSGTAVKNANLLRSALTTGTLTLTKNRSEKVSVPLHMLSIILGNECSLLGSQPEVVPMHVSIDDFNGDSCVAFLHKGAFRTEYWSAFAAYAEKEMFSLQRLMKQNVLAVRTAVDERGLPSNFATLLGILQGMKHFSAQFLESLGCASLNNSDEWYNFFLNVLEESSFQEETLDGLAEIFVEVGRQMIHNKDFICCPCGRCEIKMGQLGTVYFDQETFSFDRAAFNQICKRACCNPAAVKRDLREKGYLVGKPVNAQSYTTRVLCYNAYGQPQNIRVYKLERTRFEKLGEPPLL